MAARRKRTPRPPGSGSTPTRDARARALQVRSSREFGTLTLDVVAEVARAHPLETLRLAAIHRIAEGGSRRHLEAIREVARANTGSSERVIDAVRSAEATIRARIEET